MHNLALYTCIFPLHYYDRHPGTRKRNSHIKHTCSHTNRENEHGITLQ
uniref:Uncharacterized protein n=1 Tax=Setaria italica TaxID=4555 RepID=K4A428_SETIT